jgi:hypothetical protein
MKKAMQMAALTGMLSLAAAASAGVAHFTAEVPGECRVTLRNHAFAVGDVLHRDPTSGQFKAVRTGQLLAAVETRQSLFIVTDSAADTLVLAAVEHDDRVAAQRSAGAVLWAGTPAEERGLTLKSDWAMFVHRLLETDGELRVTQNANGFRLGDIVCLNERSGYFVKVATGGVKQEQRRGTALFLVTDRGSRNGEFLMTRVKAEDNVTAGGADGSSAVTVSEYAWAAVRPVGD